MTILAIMADNAARRAVLTVTPLAPGMNAAAMQNDKVSNVCRSTGTAMKIVAVFSKAELLGSVHFMHCNLSSTATMRVVSFSDLVGAAGAQLQDTGVRAARPWPDVAPKGDWSMSQWASAYRYGGGAHARSWMTNHTARRVEIYLDDPANAQGYIEVADIFAGSVWSPSQSPDYNPSLTTAGTGESFRDGSGGRRSIKGTKYNRLRVALSQMSESDRVIFWEMQLANGTEIPMIVSLYPESVYPARERDHQMYGALVATVAMKRPNFADHATDAEWESM